MARIKAIAFPSLLDAKGMYEMHDWPEKAALAIQESGVLASPIAKQQVQLEAILQKVSDDTKIFALRNVCDWFDQQTVPAINEASKGFNLFINNMAKHWKGLLASLEAKWLKENDDATTT